MALRPSSSSFRSVNVNSSHVIDLTGDSSDSDSSRASSPIIFHRAELGAVVPDSTPPMPVYESDSDATPVYETDSGSDSDSSSSDSDCVYLSPSDDEDVIGLYYRQQHEVLERERRLERPVFHSPSVTYVGFSALTAFIDQYESPGPKIDSSFVESSYVPAHTARLFWVKTSPLRWVKMSAFVPDTEHWTDFFHVRYDAKFFPKTLQYELIGLSTVLQLRGLSDLRFMFMNYLMSNDNFENFDYMVDRTTFDKIEFVMFNMPTALEFLTEPNPVRGLSEGLDRAYCHSCGEPNSLFIPGTRKVAIWDDHPNDWRARVSNEVRHSLCGPCKNRAPYHVRAFTLEPSESLEIVAQLFCRKDQIVQRGTRRLRLPVEPELWLKSDYVCSVTGLFRKIFPWDREETKHFPGGVTVECVWVYPQRWSLSPRHCLTDSYIKVCTRNYFPTGRNYELQEHALLIKDHAKYDLSNNSLSYKCDGIQTAVNVTNRRFRTSMNFLSVAPGGQVIRDVWQLRPYGVDSADTDYGANLYGEIRWHDVPAGNYMRHYMLRRWIHDSDTNRYDAYEVTPPNRYFRQSRLAYGKAMALYWLMAFAGVNPYAIFEVQPSHFLEPEDFCFSIFYRHNRNN